MSESYESVHPKKSAMLAAYSRCGIISRACKMAEIGRQTHYDWIKEDSAYRAAFADAHQDAIEYMESVALKRATRGWLEPVFNKGEVCGHVRKFSDTLLIFMLKGAAPEKYRDRHETKVTGTVEHDVSKDLENLLHDIRNGPSIRTIVNERTRLGGNSGQSGSNGYHPE